MQAKKKCCIGEPFLSCFCERGRDRSLACSPSLSCIYHYCKMANAAILRSLCQSLPYKRFEQLNKEPSESKKMLTCSSVFVLRDELFFSCAMRNKGYIASSSQQRGLFPSLLSVLGVEPLAAAAPLLPGWHGSSITDWGEEEHGRFCFRGGTAAAESRASLYRLPRDIDSSKNGVTSPWLYACKQSLSLIHY